MPPIIRPGGEAPRVEFVVHWTPEQMGHYFMAVADYGGMRSDREDEPLPADHPMVQLQLDIVDRALPMIASGVANGWDVKGLIVVQDFINQAMADRRADAE